MTKALQATCDLLLGWRDIVAIGSRTLISSGCRATVIKLRSVKPTKFYSQTSSVAGRDVFQIPARQQAVDVEHKFIKLIRNTMTLIIFFLLISSFTSIDKGYTEYAKLLELEHRALQNTIGKVYVYDLTGRKDCNKTRIKYLGVVHTNRGKRYKILTSFFVFSASSTCHETSKIKIFNMENQYIGEYYVGMPESLPDILRNNKLLYSKNSADCNLRKTRYINLRNGLPKMFFIPCSKNGGDKYSFSSGN